ncbi:PilZ domain-containing protein [Tepidiphilus olei]|jgi:hypothetical protein|uniref:PilZ domain-containing protein n=1 Tax=Tepidiphilus olei TaxID=2502184 RepID=UPI00115DD82E|nr:PilZ domain-containing protein [Tepidiphilus olei]
MIGQFIERRRERRIPLPGGIPARVLSPRGEVHDAVCFDLSVGGMALRTNYVPSAEEILAVQLEQPGGVHGMPGRPLRVRLEVRRCLGLEGGTWRCELGGRIVEVLS